ncbi:MAG: hypothetical protein HT580_03505 [Dechloromonas sp.]|nr:MAG: hypothetical protein HT580_03505 [Dechloromonas sp.]
MSILMVLEAGMAESQMQDRMNDTAKDDTTIARVNSTEFAWQLPSRWSPSRRWGGSPFAGKLFRVIRRSKKGF